MQTLSPELFDLLIIGNICVGLLIAGRRFLRDIRGPLPDDAPEWARADHDKSAARGSSPHSS